MEIRVHKLIRITLVNWYLFNCDDIEINGQSILLTGQNGAGKSSILDALQTILAGADENRTMFNAASSDGTRSGRTVRSYVLGEVADPNSNDVCKPRAVSNSYISLTFIDTQGRYYSFGCGFYARSDRPQVDKHLFIVKGIALNRMDFLQDEYMVLPYRNFEKRLQHMDGQLIIPATAIDYRSKIAEVMSGPTARHAINPDAMFRVISQGLKFKPQKNVTEFTRNHVLPERDIEVLRIENDYQNYLDIQNEISHAKERLEMLKAINKHFRQFQQASTKAMAYKWSAVESAFLLADEQLENALEETEKLKSQDKTIQKETRALRDQVQKALEQRDQAMTERMASDQAGHIQIYEEKIKHAQSQLRHAEVFFTQLRHSFIRIEGQSTAFVEDSLLREKLEAALAVLQRQTAFATEDMTRMWPIDEDNLRNTFGALDYFTTPMAELEIVSQEYLQVFRQTESEIRELTEIHKQLSQGKASLAGPTEEVITLLRHKDIIAVPICDLVDVVDESWQEGIERYLGLWNREALLIVDQNNEIVDTDTFEKALRLYRHAKNQNKALRSVKLLNPEKIDPPRSRPEEGTAAALIRSDNMVVLHYLQGLLQGVELVQTEAELRQKRRAITSDGMVAANGAISGGNRLDFFLFGKAMRQQQAEQLHRRLTHLLETKTDLQQKADAYKKYLTEMTSSLKHIETAQQEAYPQFINQIEHRSQLEKFQTHRQKLAESDSYIELTRRFEKANEAHQKLVNTLEQLIKRQSSIASQIQTLETRAPTLEQAVEHASQQRHALEANPNFDSQLASEVFNEMSESLAEDYASIQQRCYQKASDQQRVADTAREDGIKKLVEMVSKHDLEDKEELVNASPLEILARCETYADTIEHSEITQHEEDARQVRYMMLEHFRSEVASKLKDNLLNLQGTFFTLNKSLETLYFNNTKFQFVYSLVDIESMRNVYEYVMLDEDTSGGLFDEHTNHPGLKVIEKVITEGRLEEISDYRNFYTYDIKTKDIETDASSTYSWLLNIGSGGEQQAPFYVVLGASFLSAFKLQKTGDKLVTGGAALAIFDEAMSKMDGVNTAAALRFLQALGLQIILAAPPDASIKISPYVDKTVTVIRSGNVVALDQHIPSSEAIELLESDNPEIHPELSEKYLEAVKKEYADE